MKKYNDVTLRCLKQYLFGLKAEGAEDIALIYNKKELLKYVKKHEKALYAYSSERLVESKSYKELEYNLMIMNVLYENINYLSLKNDLYAKLIKQDITLEVYSVLRYLSHQPLLHLVSSLYYTQKIDALTAAKCCLMDELYEEALSYLYELDECDNDNVLKMIAGQSMSEYLKLKDYYTKKKRVYQGYYKHGNKNVLYS